MTQEAFPIFENQKYQNMTLSAVDFLAKLSVLLGSEQVSKIHEAHSFLRLCGLHNIIEPRIYSLRMSKASSPTMEVTHSKRLSERWMSLGMTANGRCLTAKILAYPQNRERIFIIGHLRGKPRPKVFPFGANDQSADELQGQYTNTLTARYEGAQATGSYIVEGELDEKGINQLNEPKHSNDRIYGADGVAPTLNTMQGGRRQPLIATHYGFKDKPMELHEISPTLKAQSHGHEPMVIESPTILQRARGKNKGGEHKIAPTLSAKSYQDNNHVVERTPLRFLDRNQKNTDGKYSFTVDTTNTGGVKVDGRIRRLTPMECERLQGFPDGWTEGVSDTQRYKQMGNAVTVNVIEAIAERLPK